MKAEATLHGGAGARHDHPVCYVNRPWSMRARSPLRGIYIHPGVGLHGSGVGRVGVCYWGKELVLG